MKILLFDNSSLTPKDGDYCCEPKTGLFAKELVNLGFNINMYGQKVNAFDTVHTFKLNENGIIISGLRRRKNKLLNYILLYLRAIPEIIKSDFVYIFYPNAFKYIALLCIIFRKRYGLYIRGEQNLNDKASQFLYKKAFTVFTVSDKFTQFVNSIAEREIAYTIRPMIPFTEMDIIRDRVYNATDKFKILFLGRIAFDKGIEELLNAVKILKDKNYQFNLTLVGSGEFLKSAKQITDKFNLNDIVFFVGSEFEPEKVKKYYIDSDIYILPTYHEGFPRTLYEAMMFGTPIITTFVGAIPSLMKNKYNCKEITPKSVESIVTGVEFAINNYSQMVKYAKNAIKTIDSILDSKKPTHAKHLSIKLNETTTN